MCRSRPLLLLCLACLPCACRPAAPTVTAPVGFRLPGQRDETPRLVIRDQTHVSVGDTELTTWHVEVDHLKELAVELLFLKDGEKELISSVKYEWSPWEVRHGPGKGQVYLLMQGGAPFDATGKRTPALEVAFGEEPGFSRSARQLSRILDPSLTPVSGASTKATTLRPGTTKVIHYQLFRGTGDGPESWDDTLESMLGASKAGGPILVVTVEMKAP